MGFVPVKGTGEVHLSLAARSCFIIHILMLLSLALRLLFQQFVFGRVPKCQGKCAGTEASFSPQERKTNKHAHEEKNWIKHCL